MHTILHVPINICRSVSQGEFQNVTHTLPEIITAKSDLRGAILGDKACKSWDPHTLMIWDNSSIFRTNGCVMEKPLILNKGETWSVVMSSSRKRSRGTQLGQRYKRDITKFETVLFHFNWSSFR